ncbi:patatin-like phospholipase family protein [Oscillibacter ruminantium]|uniref:patatin-like phospholipase family protein n=1 Tax=Oscillibacter ruminantium TaxID=1263547 RepID=UPI000312B759|nr:patatin-like phospholipase family protein [Oscillibacter ruminantium]
MGCGTLGLVFAGGGAKGAYQIGAWAAMRDYSVNGSQLTEYVTKISGTSIGSLNAALFAQGDFDKARDIWESISSSQIFNIRGIEEFKKTLYSLLKIIRAHPESTKEKEHDTTVHAAVAGALGASAIYQREKSKNSYVALFKCCVSIVLTVGLVTPVATNAALVSAGATVLGSGAFLSGTLPISVAPLVFPMALALTGFLIKSRPTKDELFAILRKLKQISSFSFLNSDGIQYMLREALQFGVVSESKIQCYATCTNLEKDVGVSFLLNGQEPKNVEQILLASSAYPFAFPEQIINGVRYCDGGFIPPNNVPTDVLLDSSMNESNSLIIEILLDSEDLVIRNNPKILTLCPSIDLGSMKSTFDFNPQRIMGRIEQGRKEMSDFLKSNRAKIEERLSDEHW